MSDEFRRRPRRAIADAILVTDAMTGQTVGRIGNLSETGMLLAARAPLREDALYQFRFRLPSPGSGPGDEYELGAHLLWIDANDGPGMHWAGLRFIAVPDDQAQRLHAWIEAESEA